ncbi:MAG: biotin--[acetyl-CoA-carboxylase] ligase [Methylococcaceae bacterium]
MFQIVGNHIVRLPQVDSTNNYANTQFRANELTEGTVFLAYEQSNGRGQMKNYWESEPGMNLTFSIVLFPDFLEIRKQFMLSKIVTLGIYAALNPWVENLRIKWPNDIYAGDMKLGGILIENSILYNSIKSSVIGIGINVNQTEFLSNAPNPTSLKLLANKQFDSELVLTQILKQIDFYYALLKDQQVKRIDQEFISVLYRINETHWFQDEQGKFEGQITGVNAIGQLLVKQAGGQLKAYHFKEVEFLQLSKER